MSSRDFVFKMKSCATGNHWITNDVSKLTDFEMENTSKFIVSSNDTHLFDKAQTPKTNNKRIQLNIWFSDNPNRIWFDEGKLLKII